MESSNPLERQSLGRPATPEELALAHALEAIYREGVKDFAEVVLKLKVGAVLIPSSGGTDWTEKRLMEELAAINKDLDGAYAAHGCGA